MDKVTVIGVGNLGSSIAYEIANKGLVDELVLIDLYRELAEGNAADIQQAIAFRNNVKVTAGDYTDAEGSQVILVTAGKPRTTDMKSRMELLQVNKKIIEIIASSIKKIRNEPIVITLTNPVDIMNYVMWRGTRFERKKVIGSAGMLDSSRFRVVLSRKYQTPILDVDAFVIGEHGDSQVPVFSRVSIKGQRKDLSKDKKKQVEQELRQSAIDVISKKGATIFAPTNNTMSLVETILKNEKKTVVCSLVLDGEYGLKNLSIGVPIILGRHGAEKILEWDLVKEERTAFLKGAEKLKTTIKATLKA